MLMDKYNEFSDAQSIIRTVAAGALDSTNVIDLGAADNQPVGEELYLNVLVTTAVAATGGAANVTIKLLTDDNTSFTSAATIWTSGAIAKGTLVAGYLIRVRVPYNTERYLKLTFTPDTNDITAGAVDAFLSPSVDEQSIVEP